MRFASESVMEKKRFNILRRLIPFLILLSGLLFPSCGFIGLLFDGKGDGENSKLYTLQMSYNYWGFPDNISTFSPLVFLFIPLNDENAFEENIFDNAFYVPTFIPEGVVIVEGLEKGPYAVLGFIDFGGDGELNMGETYAFYYMRDFISSFKNPQYIMVDSMIEEWKPHFDLDDSFFMNGLFLFSPESGQTLKGVNVGGSVHLIQIAGISIEKSINFLDIYINPPLTLLHDDVPVSGQDTWVVSVDMFGFSDGLYTLIVEGWSDTFFIDSDSVDFNYEAP